MNYGVMMLYLIASGSVSRRRTMMMTKCNKTPHADIVGTHKVGQITNTLNQLIDVFGKPTKLDNDKVSTQWVLTFKEDHRKVIATIYDWKEYEPLHLDTTYEFHIGTRDLLTSIKAKEIIEENICKLNTYHLR